MCSNDIGLDPVVFVFGLVFEEHLFVSYICSWIVSGIFFFWLLVLKFLGLNYLVKSFNFYGRMTYIYIYIYSPLLLRDPSNNYI
ncbi:hypothetical protein PRUPE_5G023100 [Prunus persica]|uniref:Uncharacterized protein n=1 Tax=Prunus persica TaxID=3760 RepID=A0A251P2G2_PRUPE|nr:hypothetical protein PRUPE_5G023100 [Prunus persica]